MAHKKPKEKDTMNFLHKKKLHDSRKGKTKLKEKMGCLPTSAFLYSLLARPSIFNDADIRIRVKTHKRAS